MHAAWTLPFRARHDARLVRLAVWAAAGALAVQVDATGAAAQWLVARCSQSPWQMAAGLQSLADHLSAFPWVSAWMALACAPASLGDGPRCLLPVLFRLALMVLAMVPACLLAAWAAGRWQGAAAVPVYVLVMVLTGQLLFVAATRLLKRLRPPSLVSTQRGFAS